MLVLCLLCALAMVGQPASAAPVGSLELAQNEELTLLFHGALQLGQALNSVYSATEARLMEARHTLGLYGRALGLLGQEVSRGRDAAQKLRASLLEMQVSTAVGEQWGVEEGVCDGVMSRVTYCLSLPRKRGFLEYSTFSIKIRMPQANKDKLVILLMLSHS